MQLQIRKGIPDTRYRPGPAAVSVNISIVPPLATMSAVAVDWTDDYMRWKVSSVNEPSRSFPVPREGPCCRWRPSPCRSPTRRAARGRGSGRAATSQATAPGRRSSPGRLRDHRTDTLRISLFSLYLVIPSVSLLLQII